MCVYHKTLRFEWWKYVNKPVTVTKPPGRYSGCSDVKAIRFMIKTLKKINHYSTGLSICRDAILLRYRNLSAMVRREL